MWTFLKRLPRRTLISTSVAAAALGVAMLMINVIVSAGSADPPQAGGGSAQGVAPPAESLARARVRCQACGIVESISPAGPLGLKPVDFEFTVRLRDGSTRTSTVASADNWRIGDRIMLVGGEDAPDSN